MKGSEKFFRPRHNAIAVALIASFGSTAWAAPGDPLGPPIPVVAAQANTGFDGASIGRDAAGNIVTVWRAPGGIMARRFKADGTPNGSEFFVDSHYSGTPDVAMDAAGDFVVAWTRTDEGGPTVHAQRFHANSSPDGAQLQVSQPLGSGSGTAIVQSPTVAMDADGDFVVAWGQGREVESGNRYLCSYGVGLCTFVGGYSVRLRRYTDGGTHAQAVQTVDATVADDISVLRLELRGGSSEARVSAAMAPDGRFVVAWNRVSQGVALLSGVYARRYGAGGLGEAKRTVSLQRDSAMPAVAMDPDGAYVVAYRRSTRTSDGIYWRSYPAGLGLGSAEIRIDTTPGYGYGAASPAVAMDPSGDYVVTWHGDGYVRAQRYAAGGGPLGINFDVATHPPQYGDFNSFDVAMDADGDFAVIWSTSWRDYSSGIFGIGNGRVDLQRYDGP